MDESCKLLVVTVNCYALTITRRVFHAPINTRVPPAFHARRISAGEIQQTHAAVIFIVFLIRPIDRGLARGSGDTQLNEY